MCDRYSSSEVSGYGFGQYLPYAQENSELFSQPHLPIYEKIQHPLHPKKRLQVNHQFHGYPICENLLKRDFLADTLNSKWVGDITYIKTDEGWLYLATVKDLCTRKIVGYAFSSHIDADLVVFALKMAYNRQKPDGELIFHSDRGIQYASNKCRKYLAEFNITQSMSRKGDPYDNAVAENFFSCLKNELIHHKHYKTRAEAHCQANRGINAVTLSNF